MPHIRVPEGLPGIVGLLAFKPTTGARLADLMHQLLRGDSPLSPTERELIAAYVSTLNSCEFCARAHASAAHHLDHAGRPATASRSSGPGADGVDPRLRALLRLAAAVVPGGSFVTADDVAAARAAGCGDEEIHDTVLLAAAFCMVNRYVDGLATVAPARRRRVRPDGRRNGPAGLPPGLISLNPPGRPLWSVPSPSPHRRHPAQPDVTRRRTDQDTAPAGGHRPAATGGRPVRQGTARQRQADPAPFAGGQADADEAARCRGAIGTGAPTGPERGRPGPPRRRAGHRCSPGRSSPAGRPLRGAPTAGCTGTGCTTARGRTGTAVRCRPRRSAGSRRTRPRCTRPARPPRGSARPARSARPAPGAGR